MATGDAAHEMQARIIKALEKHVGELTDVEIMK